MDKKVAVVTGVTGQDGSYLAELLLDKGYRVFGMKRRTSRNDLGCSQHLINDIEVVEADLGDMASIERLVRSARPHEFYNLAAQSHVGTSFEQPVYTGMASGIGVLHCLEAIRLSGLHTRFFQASTSEQFGGAHGVVPLDEETTFDPRSPYACAKMYAYWLTKTYRHAYRMFTCQAICFNHESSRRGPNFVTRKITQACARIKLGSQKVLKLGNMSAQRDWGHAKDYVRAMWMMMQHSVPDDFVVSTGETYSVETFCRLAFECSGLGDYRQYVVIDPMLYRAAEVDVLLGDSTKIRRDLGWSPEVKFPDLVREMVIADEQAEGWKTN